MESEAIRVIKTRRSVRKFKTDPIDEAIIRDVVDCGRLAATGRNDQPWEFVVVRDASMRGRIADLTECGKFIRVAPVCIAVMCRNTKYFLEDGSAAIQNMLVAAGAHSIGTCWVAGDKKPYAPQIAALLGAPEGIRLIGLIAMGYAAEPPQMPSKRSLEEVLHWERL
ncbi:nitroreductase family protein [Candidatus Sumerlaeota bacterium]|nr:nitroreductase family protein [Candidatus Sumerlaeota bacterium]